ncbi:MAG: ABC transporter ATP-binding protein [Oscillospiraceae bacterium]
MRCLEQVKAVSMQKITKTFGPVVANSNVCLHIEKGEILSLLGENGSGKTTLMNILSGIYFPDEGQIFVNGTEVTIRSPKDAFDLGIGMIHQHFKLVDVLTAAENIVLGLKEPGALNLKAVAAKVNAICEKYGFAVDPWQKIYNMSVSQKQTVEIVKVLYRGADILILDEPTAVLTPQETEKLFVVLRNMRADGKAVVIITHKLHEVMEVSDRVAVLRRGEYIGCINTSDTDQQTLVNMMVGRATTLDITRTPPVNPEPRIAVEGLTCVDKDGVKRLQNVSFVANSGEILGIAGIAGSGQKELLEAIAGLYPVVSGSVTYFPPEGAPKNLLGMSPLAIKNAGVAMAFVPEDRLGMGLVGSMGMTGNMMLRSWRNGAGPFASRRAPKALAGHLLDLLEIVTPDTEYPVRRLSGGNVQKILVGREISSSPTVLMTAYAVRGLDINTSYVIYDLLNTQKSAGVAVIYSGEDLDVLLELCDKILVLCAGQVSGILDARTTTKEEVGLLMTNLNKEEQGHEWTF